MRPTAQGLHCTMFPVIPCSSGRSKWVPFASGVFMRCLVGELGTPKFAPVGNACAKNVTQQVQSGPKTAQNVSFPT